MRTFGENFLDGDGVTSNNKYFADITVRLLGARVFDFREQFLHVFAWSWSSGLPTTQYCLDIRSVGFRFTLAGRLSPRAPHAQHTDKSISSVSQSVSHTAVSFLE